MTETLSRVHQDLQSGSTRTCGPLMFHPEGPTFWELARQALSSTERGYDLLAPKFDCTPFRTPDEALAPVDQYLRTLGPFGTGLDVCCGTGAGMRLLRSLCRERVVGLDFSRGMLEVARQRLANVPGEARLDFVRADALAMPFREAFDLAVCFGALGHILPADQPRLVVEIGRALRPGGRFVFMTCPMPPVHSARYWFARLFNGMMRLRNAVVAPPFIMYYLTFLLPEAAIWLRKAGLEVELRPVFTDGPWSDFRLVSGRKPLT